MAGLAGIRYRTFFQKCEFHEAAPREPSFHLMGALFRIRCCKPGGRCLYPSGPVSPIWIRITLISCWTSAWWRPTWKCGSTSLFNRNFASPPTDPVFMYQFVKIIPASQSLRLSFVAMQDLQVGLLCQQDQNLGWGWQSAACSAACILPPAPGGLLEIWPT